MTISPSACTGAKTAERVPTTIFACPLRTRFHSSMRSPIERPLWKTATVSPNAAVKTASVCGVSEISGTVTITPRPLLRTCRITCMKTAVLPDPVMP